MEQQPSSPREPKSLKEVMLEARLQARAEAPPIVVARMLSQVRLRTVFENFEKTDYT